LGPDDHRETVLNAIFERNQDSIVKIGYSHSLLDYVDNDNLTEQDRKDVELEVEKEKELRIADGPAANPTAPPAIPGVGLAAGISGSLAAFSQLLTRLPAPLQPLQHLATPLANLLPAASPMTHATTAPTPYAATGPATSVSSAGTTSTGTETVQNPL